jgi:hypothetical protein
MQLLAHLASMIPTVRTRLSRAKCHCRRKWAAGFFAALFSSGASGLENLAKSNRPSDLAEIPFPQHRFSIVPLDS